MSDSGTGGLDHLEEAVEAFLAWRRQPDRPPAARFLAAHERLRDLLLPMIEDAEAEQAPRASVEPAPQGKSVGDFRIVRELGRGGMGVVFEAEQRSLARRVALKVLPAAFAREPKAIARFKREALTAARLEHPGIVRVLGVGSQDDVPWFAMELVDGVALDRLVRRIEQDGVPASGAQLAAIVERELGGGAPRSTPQTASSTGTERWREGYLETLIGIALQVCEALGHAHAAGIVHRDVKPSNILLRSDGTAVLTDFGLARDFGLPSATLTGEFAGTPHYVSPEQASGIGSEIGPQSDVFSLGATLYELLTLERPFQGSTTPEVLEAIRRRDPIDPSRRTRAVHPDLAAVVLKCLEKDPRRRYAGVSELAEDLRAFLAYRPVSARRPSVVERMRRLVRRKPLEASLALTAAVVALLGIYVLATSPARRRGHAAMLRDRVDRLVEAAYLANLARQPEKAGASFERVLALDPGNVYAIVGMTILLGRPGDPELLDRIDAALEQRPGQRALERLRASVLLGLGRQQEALALGKKLGEPETPLDCFVAGMLRTPRAGGNPNEAAWKEAATLLRRAILRSPRAVLVHFIQWSMAASMADDRAAAIECADAIEQLWPESVVATLAVGIVLGLHSPERAEAALRRVLRMEPGLVLARRELALTLSASGRLDEAIVEIRAALAAEPDDATAWSILRMYLTRKQDFAAAVEAGRRAVDLAPGSAEFHTGLAAAVERAGDRQEALRLVRRAAELEPRFARAHRGILGILRIEGDVEGIRAEYERWAQENPNGAWAQFELAQFLLGQEDPPAADVQRALLAARRSVELHDGDAALLLTWARAEQASGNAEAARAALDRAEKAASGQQGADRRRLMHRIRQLRKDLGR